MRKAILHKHIGGNNLKFDTLVDFLSPISESHIDSELAEFKDEGIRFSRCHQTHCLVTSWQAGKHPLRGFVFFLCLLFTRKKGLLKSDFSFSVKCCVRCEIYPVKKGLGRVCRVGGPRSGRNLLREQSHCWLGPWPFSCGSSGLPGYTARPLEKTLMLGKIEG